MPTKTEWAEETWNPVLGCSKVSPGCRSCYAINHVHRLAANPNPKIRVANEGLTVIQGGEPNWTGKVRLIPERLEIPLRTKKPTTYFGNSLSDLFHEELAERDIDRVFATMALCPQHRFQILTKRSEELLRYFADIAYRTEVIGIDAELVSGLDRYVNPEERDGPSDDYPPRWPLPLPNVWLGVSVESREYLYRIDHLRQTPAAVRFLSLEPLLEDLGTINLQGIDWVIAGGESGKRARPMRKAWVESIRDQCLAAGVAFFFKQWGEYGPEYSRSAYARGPAFPYGPWPLPNVWLGVAPVSHSEPRMAYPFGDGRYALKLGKKNAGRMLDGRTWDEMPDGRTATQRIEAVPAMPAKDDGPAPEDEG